MLSWSAWANIWQENYLCSDDPHSTTNFAEENNLQFCLDGSGPTLHKKIVAMLTYGWQTMIMRKIIYTMLYRPLGQQWIRI